jgi:hypothetical protein
MSNLEFEYEFNFVNGLFEQTIYDNYQIVDTTGTRQTIIENMVDEVLKIFTNVPGLNIFSTFVTVNSVKYKISVKNVKK